MSRLVVVSNRVATPTENKNSSGGLAVGVFSALKDTGGVWFGWSGEIINEGKNSSVPHIVQHENVTFVTVDLSRRDYDQYYKGFSNGTLWPIFHYRNDLAHFERHEYAGYRRVNKQLARQLLPLLKSDDIIWVHDYHLIPFAEELRLAGIKNRIGYFLHIPFPAPQVILNVPVHEELFKSISYYNIVGFQTKEDEQSFQDYIVRHLNGVVKGNRIHVYNRILCTGVYRIGIFPDEVAEQAARYAKRHEVRELKRSIENRKLVMSVDRLDYSKGIVERFKAFEQFLETSPDLQNQVSLVQIAPPTRSDVATYQQIRRKLEYEAGRINGRFSGLNYTPIRYLNRRYDRWVLMSLFRIARVGFVTPLRDGMNLVAKEYVAAQDPEQPGVLVLSRFAGAAAELDAAIIVNPHDIAGMAEALIIALKMPLAERCERHKRMLCTLRRNDLNAWRDGFLHDLKSAPSL